MGIIWTASFPIAQPVPYQEVEVTPTIWWSTSGRLEGATSTFATEWSQQTNYQLNYHQLPSATINHQHQGSKRSTDFLFGPGFFHRVHGKPSSSAPDEAHRPTDAILISISVHHFHTCTSTHADLTSLSKLQHEKSWNIPDHQGWLCFRQCWGRGWECLFALTKRCVSWCFLPLRPLKGPATNSWVLWLPRRGPGVLTLGLRCPMPFQSDFSPCFPFCFPVKLRLSWWVW